MLPLDGVGNQMVSGGSFGPYRSFRARDSKHRAIVASATVDDVNRAPGEKSDMVERRAVRRHTRDVDSAERGLEAEDSAGVCRVANRAASIGAKRKIRQTGGDGDTGAAGTPARTVVAVPRIDGLSECAWRGARKLRRVRLADEDRSGAFEPSASSLVTVMNAFNRGLRVSIRPRIACVTSTGDSFFCLKQL